MGDGIGFMVAGQPDRVEPATSRAASLGDLEDLVDSIRRHGILEPLLVRRRQ
jgi:ParB-like chromosome segregation protein Spo0J